MCTASRWDTVVTHWLCLLWRDQDKEGDGCGAWFHNSSSLVALPVHRQTNKTRAGPPVLRPCPLCRCQCCRHMLQRVASQHSSGCPDSAHTLDRSSAVRLHVTLYIHSSVHLKRSKCVVISMHCEHVKCSKLCQQQQRLHVVPQVHHSPNGLMLLCRLSWLTCDCLTACYRCAWCCLPCPALLCCVYVCVLHLQEQLQSLNSLNADGSQPIKAAWQQPQQQQQLQPQQQQSPQQSKHSSPDRPPLPAAATPPGTSISQSSPKVGWPCWLVGWLHGGYLAMLCRKGCADVMDCRRSCCTWQVAAYA